VKCSITSRNSQLASVSAPSADLPARAKVFSKNFPPPRHTSHTPMMCAPLCTSWQNTRALPELTCTPVFPPQRTHTAHTADGDPIHNTIAPLAASRYGYPQNAHPLILLLRYLLRFFFEEQPWGSSFAQGLRVSRRPGLSASAISFEDGLRGFTVVLRLPFAVVVVAQDAAPAFVAGEPHTGGGRLAIGFELLLGEGTLWTRRRQELA
jgi:hypothetical protein